jgi:outer membrane receptor protein involved in Fe transport
LSFDHYFDDTTALINDASPLAPGCSFTYTGGTNPAPGTLGNQPNCNLPGGALRATPISVPETFASTSSLALTAQLQLTSRLEIHLGGYFTHYIIDAQQENPALLLQYAQAGVQGIAPVDFIPSYNTASHFDPRFGLVFRPAQDWVLRFTAGSAMTIPYASLVSGSLSYAQSVASTTESTPNYGLLPEETVTLDAGTDYRTPNGTVLSADLYNMVVHNPWISTKVTICTNTPGCPPNNLEGTSFFESATFNGAQQYAQGFELTAANLPNLGFGYRVDASFERNYYLDTPRLVLGQPRSLLQRRPAHQHRLRRHLGSVRQGLRRSPIRLGEGRPRPHRCGVRRREQLIQRARVLRVRRRPAREHRLPRRSPRCQRGEHHEPELRRPIGEGR